MVQNDGPMSKAEATALTNSIVLQAFELGPHDPLTLIARTLGTGLGLVLALPTLIVMIPSTLIGGCLVSATFGILLVPLNLLWMPFLGFVIGSSWLWIKVPVSRPFLLIPGVLLSAIANLYVALVPDMGESYQKQLKMALCDNWPNSYLVWKVSLQYRVS